MARPVKLYNHSVAPNPRRVRIFAAEKGIELGWKKLIFWPGKAARRSSSLRTRQARCLCLNLMTVHTSPSQSQSAGIWRGFNLNRTC
jgi:hypothetical protein